MQAVIGDLPIYLLSVRSLYACAGTSFVTPETNVTCYAFAFVLGRVDLKGRRMRLLCPDAGAELVCAGHAMVGMYGSRVRKYFFV